MIFDGWFSITDTTGTLSACWKLVRRSQAPRRNSLFISVPPLGGFHWYESFFQSLIHHCHHQKDRNNLLLRLLRQIWFCWIPKLMFTLLFRPHIPSRAIERSLIDLILFCTAPSKWWNAEGSVRWEMMSGVIKWLQFGALWLWRLINMI